MKILQMKLSQSINKAENKLANWIEKLKKMIEELNFDQREEKMHKELVITILGSKLAAFFNTRKLPGQS